MARWDARDAILADVNAERLLQLGMWGDQHHPDGTARDAMLLTLAGLYRDTCQDHARRGTVTWADILLEEVFEAITETDRAALRSELVQVAAVAVAWVEDVDSRPEGGAS